jgi:hypothetical protein
MARLIGNRGVGPIAAVALAAAVAALCSRARADWPEPAVRSGTHLPDERELALALALTGAYVPRVEGLSADHTGALSGILTWNLAPFQRIGLFGQHSAGGMWWDNLRLDILGNEIGLRYLCLDHLAFEAAYLTHRVDRLQVDELETHPGGVIDRGFELGTWFRFEPHRRLLVEAHLVGRVFEVYRDTQGITGLGLRVSISPAGGHALVLELEALRVVRSRPRVGVERVTWNVLGEIAWRSLLTDELGLEVGARVSTNLAVGEVPMLELKRSMIDEPMALGSAGLFFSI